MENIQSPSPCYRRSSSHQLHLPVWGLIGVAISIFASYPTAMWRVSQMEKFKGLHVIQVNQISPTDFGYTRPFR